MKSRPFLALFGLLTLSAAAFGVGAQIQLLPQTSVSVADSRSTVTINATIYTASGNLVPDGTQVVFSASNGSIRDQIVTTQQGRVRAVLVAPGTPGTCIVTATAAAYGAVSTTEIEFFSDRSLLDTAKEYIEVYAPGDLSYASKAKVITASAPDQGIHLRYREVEIDADDLQLNVPTYEVRAKHAHVKMGKIDFETPNLYIKLNARKGYAYGHFQGPTLVGLKPYGPWMKPIVEPKDHFGFAALTPAGLKAPDLGANEDYAFTFASLQDDETTVIQAKKAIAFPRKEVQFQQATIFVGGAKALKLPLYRDAMNSNQSYTEQIVSVNNNQLSVNYPYYLSLKPGTSSLLRFRTGDTYGRTSSGTGRVSLDYELNWNKGDNVDGGLVFSGIARKDWNLALRQYVRMNDGTTLYANVEVPASRALFGSASLSRQFKGFGLSLNGIANHSFTGPRFDTKSVSLAAESNAIKAGSLPFRLYFGVAANTQSTSNSVSGPLHQDALGVAMRAQLVQQRLDRNSSLNANFRIVRNLTGSEQPLGITGSATISRAINRNANILLTYDYNNDGFNSKILGQHSLNLNANVDVGKLHFSGYALRSLDVNRLTYFFDASYRFSQRWSFLYSHTFSAFLGDSFLEYYPTLAYDIGGRQIGLTWNNRTKRLGFQFLGVPLN